MTKVDKELKTIGWHISNVEEDVLGSGVPSSITYQYFDYDEFVKLKREYICGNWNDNVWEFQVATENSLDNPFTLSSYELRKFISKIDELENNEIIKSRAFEKGKRACQKAVGNFQKMYQKGI